MAFNIRPLKTSDYEQVYALWEASEGIGLSNADSKAAISAFLERNPDLSLVAVRDEKILGAVLCGHDGRRGFIHHLAVQREERGKRIGRTLVEGCAEGLRSAGIDKVHLYVFTINEEARRFWEAVHFYPRPELLMMSQDLGAASERTADG